MSSPMSRHTSKIADAAKKRREKFLSVMAQGGTIKECAEAAGVKPRTYEAWVKRYPEFRKQRDEIRRLQRAEKHEEAKKEAGVAELDGTFEDFRLKMFDMDTYWHQAEMVRAIENVKPMGIALVNVAPEMGKTTLLCDYACYRVAYDPNIRITLVSEGQNHSRKLLAQIKRRMTRSDMYPEFITRFGPFHIPGEADSDKVWSADQILVHKADHDEKDPTIECRGVTSAIAGTRADLMIFDDVQSLRSLGQTEKIAGLMRQDFFTRLGKDSKCIYIGTRVGPGDVYEWLVDEGLISQHVKLPALDSDGKSLCPEMWPTDLLLKRKQQVGEEVWLRNYQQKSGRARDKTFPEQTIKMAQRNNLTASDVVLDGKTVLACLDPALAGGNALHVGAYDNENYWLKEMWVDYDLGRNEAIFARIAEAAGKYSPSKLIIEDNALQTGLARDQRLRDLSDRFGFQIVPHRTSETKLDPQWGIPRMPTPMGDGEIHIPWAEEDDRAMFAELVGQLRKWRPDVPTKQITQDCVMSLWFGVHHWLKRRRYEFDTENILQQWQRRGVHDLLDGHPGYTRERIA